MLPIKVMYDSGIDKVESEAILDALQELVSIFPDWEIELYGANPWCRGEFSSADWYVQNAQAVPRLDHYQLDAGSLLWLLEGEPWQEAEPHIDVMLTSLDLAALNDDGSYLNFVFGMADGRFTVQSAARFRELPDADRYLAVKMLIQHELGHIVGMAADLTRPNTVNNLGPHCTNFGCVMRQGLSVPVWAQHARESYNMGRIYCPQCLADAGVRVSPQVLAAV